ncbi:MAG: class I SAM-dependent methyltransferase family protein, partial [Myxococcales bacterium]|nr:class I SAM-dependent methyltransferase family protein [Myxococcales bacterium]
LSRTPGGVPEAVADELALRFRMMFRELEEVATMVSAEELGAIEDLIARRLYPWVAASGVGERALHKPAGYAGDFQTIRMVYADQPLGSCWAGRFIDARILESPAAWAVKNRRALLVAEIEQTRVQARAEGRRARVATLGAGPAEELFDVHAGVGSVADMPLCTLVDMDLDALGHVADRAAAEGCAEALQPLATNIARAALGRSEARLVEQDLIYSAGLIDYFKDNLLVRLLDWIHAGLRPGGRTLLGNFHRENPTRRMMETVLEWELIHRDEDDMRRIFAKSKFGADNLRFCFDPSGVNLFVEATRID